MTDTLLVDTALVDPVAAAELIAAPWPRPAPARRSRLRGLRPAVITTLGVLGLLAIVLALLPLGGLAVVRLATGSMSPLYPADSLLLAQSIPASAARIGDVVMVQRPGELPVTHRVIATRSLGSATELRLKGDANTAPDPEPYDVTRVDRVLGGIPWGGQVLVVLQSPWALGAMTVVASLLVLWAWWPRRDVDAAGAEPDPTS